MSISGQIFSRAHYKCAQRNKGETCYPYLRFTQRGYFDTDQEIDIGDGHISMAQETSDNVRVSKKYFSEYQ